jgi:lipid-A-disaccharide synthase
VLIDFPGFHIRLAEQLKRRGIKVYQYVAPKLWAWGEGRVAALKQNFDAILGILPFEESFFAKWQVPYRYVGNPIKDRMNRVAVDRSLFGFKPNEKILVMLPGSRVEEIKRSLSLMVQIVRELQSTVPHLVVICPVALSLTWSQIEESLPDGLRLDEEKKWGVIKFVRGMSYECMRIADAALVTSGTATLECALARTPMVVIYSMNDLSYWIAERVVKVPYISLVNLILDRKVVTEHIQRIDPHAVVTELKTLLVDSKERQSQVASFAELHEKLKGNAAFHAAKYILADVYPKA